MYYSRTPAYRCRRRHWNGAIKIGHGSYGFSLIMFGWRLGSIDVLYRPPSGQPVRWGYDRMIAIARGNYSRDAKRRKRAETEE